VSDNPYRHDHNPLNADFHGGICPACEWEQNEGSHEPSSASEIPARRNAVRCQTCLAEIESLHRHDLRRCNCESSSGTVVYVDGGASYAKRLFGPDAQWEELA
jgi:hypothetical protein